MNLMDAPQGLTLLLPAEQLRAGGPGGRGQRSGLLDSWLHVDYVNPLNTSSELLTIMIPM